MPASIGTQTVGSILRPSAFCGVVGLKGAHGDVPLDGALPLAPSLDHAGTIARSVADAALVEGVLVGRPLVIPDLERPLLATNHVLFDQASPELRAHLDATIGRFLDAGGEVVEVDLPSSFMALLDAGRAILEAEAAAVHEAWFRDHADGTGHRSPGSCAPVSALDPAAVAHAREVRTAFRSAIAPLLEGVDALLSPVAPGPAPLRSEGTGDFVLCAPWSFAGVPSIAIPTGLDDSGPAAQPPAGRGLAGPGTPARGSRLVRGGDRVRRRPRGRRPARGGRPSRRSSGRSPRWPVRPLRMTNGCGFAIVTVRFSRRQ